MWKLLVFVVMFLGVVSCKEKNCVSSPLVLFDDLSEPDVDYYLYDYDTLRIEIPSVVTPNNDGFNDNWTPRDIKSYQNAVVQIFNRWGGMVFESKGGESYQPWDGTNNGEELPVGTYYYIIDLNTDDEPQTGPITLIR